MVSWLNLNYDTVSILCAQGRLFVNTLHSSYTIFRIIAQGLFTEDKYKNHMRQIRPDIAIHYITKQDTGNCYLKFATQV